ncbi:MAG: potassium transporter [Alphaproteobacteria bacterium]|nr:potassium transporter [Alphaproteobacteria bacterium]
MPHDLPFVEAFAFLAAAVIAVPIAKRIGLGSVLGYLIAGAILGPFGLKLFGDPENMMHVAEFGVVIMLFLIGLELRPELLWRMRDSILGLGGFQVLLTGLALAGAAMALGAEWRMALAVGFILALSSTAIVMQSLRERGLAATDPGRSAFAVLLFQDIAVIPMLALFPLLAMAPAGGEGEAHGVAALPAWAQALAVLGAVGGIVLAGRFLLRPVFRYIARAGMQEIFTAFALAIVVGVALLMQVVGLSPALGAFVAGVVLADSEYRHELESDIEPFRGLLLGLFFVSVGAAIDFAMILAQPLFILGLVVGLICIKAAVLFLLARGFKRPAADASLVALSLAQGGEFAFVLFAFAQSQNVVTGAFADPLIAAVALSMALTPLLLIVGERISTRLSTSAQRATPDALDIDQPHAIIAGFGRFGQIPHRLLKANGFRTSVLEHNAEQVELARGFGHRANYGDASRLDLLRAAGAADAQLLVIAVNDAEKATEIVEISRKHFPNLKVIARAFDRLHYYDLMDKGVDAAERETFEGGLRLGVKALRALGYGAHQAERAGRLFRRHDERQLEEMRAHWAAGEFETYRSAVTARQTMLEEALQRDLASQGVTRGDEAWDTESLDEEAKRRA